MKKVLTVVLGAVLCLSAALSLAACTDNEILGTYMSVSGTGSSKAYYYLELKSGKKCSIYKLETDDRGKPVSKETLIKGLDFFSGKFSVEDKTIYLTLDNINDKSNPEVLDGEILSNGNIRIQFLGAVRSLKKQ